MFWKYLKKLQNKTARKNVKADVEKYIKNCPIYAIKKHGRFRKKISPIFTATKNIFPKICIGFCHWITGISKSNDRNLLLYSLQNNRRIDKIRKISFMQNYHDSKKINNLFFQKIFANQGIPE